MSLTCLITDCLFTILLAYTHILYFFFFNDTATTEIYTLSLHDALPISPLHRRTTDRGPRRDDTRQRRMERPDREPHGDLHEHGGSRGVRATAGDPVHASSDGGRLDQAAQAVPLAARRDAREVEGVSRPSQAA